jgi:hypothetical protein
VPNFRAPFRSSYLAYGVCKRSTWTENSPTLSPAKRPPLVLQGRIPIHLAGTFTVEGAGVKHKTRTGPLESPGTNADAPTLRAVYHT